MRELFSKDRVTGFLHADGQKMVNGKGEQIILRGWGMGNWDNPEGFMIGAADDFDLSFGHAPMGRIDRGRSLEQIVRETCGSKYLETFWDRWHRAWLNEGDIKLLADRGYNSVRLPIRACSFLKEEPGIQWNEESFAMLTDVLDWCEKHRVYAIIDLHAATAGQSCLPCDDGVDNAPHLFIDDEAMERMYILMEEFARRYKDRWIVGGYDCINEPLSVTPRMFELLPKLKEFYAEMVRRFRVIDKNHMFLLNGTQFSSRMDVFDRDYDPECRNWAIAIHAYAMVSPEPASFSDAFKKCGEWNVPLWLGETGTSLEYAWQTTVYEMLRERGAGYNLWSFKTCGDTGAAKVLKFDPPAGWQRIVDYALKGGAKPSYAEAQQIFDAYLEAAKCENCTEDASYHSYLLREGDFEIPAVGYNDLPADGRRGQCELPSGIGYRQSDRFDIVYEEGFPLPVTFPGAPVPGHVREHMHLRLHAGEFASYTVLEPGAYTVSAAYSAAEPAKVRVTADGQLLFEGDLPAAAEHPAAPGEKHPLFPEEAAPNHLAEFCFGKIQGEHVFKVEVTEGTVDLGKIVIRKEC